MFISATISSSAAALPELDADVPVAALRAAARRDEVAHAGEARERERIAAERDAETGELGQPAGDERGLRVVAVAEAVARCPAPIASTFFSAPAISQPTTSGFVYTRNVGVEEQLLQLLGDRRVAGRDHRRGRLARRDLLGEVRTGQHADARRVVAVEHLGDHLGHAAQRALLDALRQADHAARAAAM